MKKLNKKIFGVLVSLCLMGVFSVSAINDSVVSKSTVEREKTDKKFKKTKTIALDYAFKNKGMKLFGWKNAKKTDIGEFEVKNNTTAKDCVNLYIILKEILGRKGFFNERNKNEILSKIFGGCKKESLKLGGRVNLIINKEDEVNLNSLIKNTDFKHFEITEKMYNDSFKEIKNFYNKTIKGVVNNVKECKKKVKKLKEEINRLSDRQKKSYEKSMKNLLLKKENAESSKKFNSSYCDALKSHLYEISNLKFKDIKDANSDLIFNDKVEELK